ncbi:tetratricopeptide repeat protein [Desulfonatronum thioautotrophicum]|uniref:tetratricopeptide repeat protein n=1 Tax=Desulfonatronum thioautotrophicum TaxID=617001 RepID=UPI0005EB8F51|nr:tetratricopeptide repeat protein [Desulfonatronum thioautotrophicum]
MYLLSDILKSLPNVTNPRLVLSGFGVWVTWRKNVNSTIHQTLTRFGGQKVASDTHQSLWFFHSAQVFPALARLLLWAQIQPEPVFVEILPIKILLGESVNELSVSIVTEHKNQKITPGETFDVWVHPDLIKYVATFPGLSSEQRPPIFGMTPEAWHTFKVDPGFSLDANLGWFFFVKPMQDKENENFILHWKNFYMRLKGILDRLSIRYIYQNNLLFFNIEGLALLSSWCREIQATITHVKSEEQNAYWPCLYQAVELKGMGFNDELPSKISFEWERLAPDALHVPLSAGLLLREEFAVTFLDPAGTLTLDALCQLSHTASDSVDQPRLNFPASATTSFGKKTPCFYCGMKSHDASGCPSRQIFNPDQGIWQKIGTMDLKEMVDGVKSLDKAVGDKGNLAAMPELLLGEGPEHTLLKGIFEITFPLQHRMLRMVWRSRGKELPDGLRQLVPPEGEYIWAALENTRARTYSQAERMMQQAILRTSKSYQPHVLLGFIALETDNARKAEGHWKDALNLGYTPLQQSYFVFLKARLREIQGNHDQAHEIYREAHGYCPKWMEPRYRQAVCLTKKGFLDQAWMVFAELISEDPHYFNRILLDHELERGRSFLLSALAGPWNAAKQRSGRDLQELQQVGKKLDTWFSPENAFRKETVERLTSLQEQGHVENYVSFSKTTTTILHLQKETDNRIKEAVAELKGKIRQNSNRLREVYEEIVYFPFPRMIRKINKDYNKGGRILQALAKSDLHNGKTFRQAVEEMKDVDEILAKMDKRMRSLKFLRDGSLFFLFLSKTFLWLAMFGLLASIVAVPVLLHSIQDSGSAWAMEWLTNQRWQVQRTVSMMMVFISGVAAAIWTSFRYEKQKQRYLAKKGLKRKK